MNTKDFNITEEQKALVLARLKTLNPESKITLGDHEEISVRKIIKHVEEGDDFGVGFETGV